MIKLVNSILFTLLLVGFVSLAQPVQAIDNSYYVSTTGSDTTGDGSSGNPWATIHYAIGQATSGDVVHVAAGTYDEVITLKDGVQVLGAGALVTTIHGTGGLVVNGNGVGSSTKLDGFTISGGRDAEYGGMQVAWSSSPVVSNCIFSGNSATYGGGMSIEWGSSPTVTNCLFLNNSARGYGGGMHIYASWTTVTNCIFQGNSSTASAGWGSGGGMDIQGSTVVITNCTFYGNSAVTGGSGMCFREGGHAGPSTVTNCVLWGDIGTEIYDDFLLPPVITYCDVQGGYAGTGNISGDPQFINPTTGNLHVQPGSPCIDSGNNSAPSLPSTDFEGYPRIWNSIVDMGAYEYTPPPKVTTVSPDSGRRGQAINVIITGENFTPAATVNFGPGITVSSTTDNSTQITADITIAPDAIFGSRDVTVTTSRGTGTKMDGFTVLQQSAQVATATGTGIATITTSDGSITGLTAAASTACGDIPPGLYFPHGFFSFNITNIPAGSTVTITINLPSNVPTNTEYWKCMNGQWVNATSILGSNNGDSIITLTLTDGGPFDADGQANSTIVDPAGPAIKMEMTTAPGLRAAPSLPRQLNQAQLSLQYLNVNPKQTAANQPVTITTNVVNTGDEAGNLNVALKINGQVEQARLISVGPQATQPVKFTVIRSQPGTYTVNILDQNGSFTILGANSTAGKPVNGGLVVLIVMVVLILATVVVLMTSRRPA